METVDGLPPEARFLLRVLHAGRGLDEAAALLGLEPDDAAKRLRAALLRSGHDAPPAAAGTSALLAAAAPLVAAAGRPPSRAPATACLPPAVAAALGTRNLAGPLLLASAEHAADCPACLDQVLAAREGAADAAPEPTRAGAAPPVLGAAVVVALIVGAALVVLLVLLR